MIKIAVSELPQTREFPYAILHECGDVLREAGEPLLQEEIEAMKQASISDVYLVEQDDNVFIAGRSLRTFRMPLSALTTTDEADDPLLAVRVNLPQSLRPLRFTDTTKRFLEQNDVRDVLVRKPPEQLREWQVKIYRTILAAREQVRAAAAREVQRESERRARPIPPPPGQE